MVKALIVLIDGFDETETFTVSSLLKKAKIEVVLAGLVSTVVESENKTKIITDKRISEIENDYDMIILPGGECYKSFLNSQTIINMVKDFNKKEKYIAAIGESVSVLVKSGVLEKKIATIYPGMEKKLPRPRDAKLIVDTNIITARSQSVSVDFALKLIEILSGKRVAKKVKEIIWA